MKDCLARRENGGLLGRGKGNSSWRNGTSFGATKGGFLSTSILTIRKRENRKKQREC